MNVEPFSPFGRGSNAPLAGRTILQIARPGSAGGDERSTLAVAAALVQAGARALVASDPGELAAAELHAVGGLHIPFPAATKNPVALSLNVRRHARILESERVELVHARSRGAAWAALAACRKLKRPVVTSIPGEGADLWTRTRFESAVADGDLVIMSSQHAADRAADIFPAARARLRVVRPGIDLSRLGSASVSPERVSAVRGSWGAAAHVRVALAPGRLAPGRGQTTLIEAAALIMGRSVGDVRIVVAGEAAKPAFARKLDALAVERGVDSLVVRIGAPTDRAASFIGATAVVFPATDGGGVTRAIIEAAGMGALTIVSDVGPAREIVAAPPYALAEARSGWLVPPSDATALADAIEAAFTLGASAREAARRRARARIVKHYSIERMTKDTLSVYAEALQTRGG